MDIWQIILALVIVGLSIIMPIYYSLKKKKLAQQLKEGRQVSEREKIRVYIDQINQQSRDRNRKL
tara:strand:- start:289 stop:483 length:195 start_codon:yes stop_codon:yes gene_type:complete